MQHFGELFWSWYSVILKFSSYFKVTPKEKIQINIKVKKLRCSKSKAKLLFRTLPNTSVFFGITVSEYEF